tara:strand:- start:250 stop:891 length:642 start_codon:yes stop_codon:yes gene_type:complete
MTIDFGHIKTEWTQTNVPVIQERKVDGIEVLKNPKTEHYRKWKQWVLSNEFPWYMYKKQQPDSFHKTDQGSKFRFNHPKMNLNKMGHAQTFIHPLLGRPNDNEPFPQPLPSFPDGLQVVKEIFSHNNIRINCLYRMAVNMVPPDPNVETTFIHVDHGYPHLNMLVYLTDVGGETILENDYHDPKEDDIIIFEGYHTHNVPKKDNRVILVTTFF